MRDRSSLGASPITEARTSVFRDTNKAPRRVSVLNREKKEKEL